jgi:hypothetical protein
MHGCRSVLTRSKDLPKFFCLVHSQEGVEVSVRTIERNTLYYPQTQRQEQGSQSDIEICTLAYLTSNPIVARWGRFGAQVQLIHGLKLSYELSVKTIAKIGVKFADGFYRVQDYPLFQ